MFRCTGRSLCETWLFFLESSVWTEETLVYLLAEMLLFVWELLEVESKVWTISLVWDYFITGPGSGWCVCNCMLLLYVLCVCVRVISFN